MADHRKNLSVRYELTGDSGRICSARAIVERDNAERHSVDPAGTVDLFHCEIDPVLILDTVGHALRAGRAKQVLPRLAGAGDQDA